MGPGRRHPFLPPETAQESERLVRPRAALAERHGATGELPGVLSADSDADDEPAARDVVERGQVLGGEDGMAERQEVDGGAEADPARAGGEAREEDGGADRLRVEEDMLAGPQGVEAEGLGPLGEPPPPRGGRHAVGVGGERDPEAEAPAHGARRKRGMLISGVTSSKTTLTGMPIRISAGGTSTRFAVRRGPSSSSTWTTA